MHFERLKRDSGQVGLRLSVDEATLHQWAMAVVAVQGKQEAALKILHYKDRENTRILITMRDYPYKKADFEKGYNVKFSQVQRHSQNPIYQIKSMNYMNNIVLKRTLEKGVDELLFLNEKEEVTEGIFTNFFIVKENKILTPDLQSGLLNGIIRRNILQYAMEIGYFIEETNLTKEDVLSAEEAFFTNALVGIMPIKSIEDKVFDLENNRVTSILEKNLFERMDSVHG